jgi:hypothetical protein
LLKSFYRFLFRAWREAIQILPDGVFTCRLISLPIFLKFHRRFPRKADHAQATFADIIFSKTAGPWTEFQRRCVDKDQAKEIAKSLCPKVRTVPTLARLSLTGRTSLREVEVFLRPFMGKRLVAKPAHASGNVVLLDRVEPGQVEKLFRLARQDFFQFKGERQYRNLSRKILVEESLAPKGLASPTDYRFFCSRGKAWFGAADVGRFVDLREYHFTVPRFAPVYIQTHGRLPSRIPTRPRRFREMIEIAETLAKPFDFVRIDLYQTLKGIFFGEFTFTPMGGFFNLSNVDLSKWLARKALDPEATADLPRKWTVKKQKLNRRA